MKSFRMSNPKGISWRAPVRYDDARDPSALVTRMTHISQENSRVEFPDGSRLAATTYKTSFTYRGKTRFSFARSCFALATRSF
jgi:hypothetical protein